MQGAGSKTHVEAGRGPRVQPLFAFAAQGCPRGAGMRLRVSLASLGVPPLRPAPILPALAPAVPGSSSPGKLPHLNKITCIKNTESWRADSVCLNIYPCSDQALCSHDSAISTWHIYGLPGCRAPHAACPGATDPPSCVPSVAPCALSGDPWAGSHLQPGTSLLGCAGAARNIPGWARQEWAPHLSPTAQELQCHEVQGRSSGNSLLPKNRLLLLLLPAGTEGLGTRGHRHGDGAGMLQLPPAL